MGVVFLGEDIKLARKVAIKAMLPHLAQSKSSQQRFLREARAAAALEHDHIVAIHHVSEDRGAPYIVMPFLKEEPLDERLKRPEPMPLADVLRIGREVAKALAAAHQAGLVHRDIKPANIWLEAPEDRVKILDFGLARAAASDSGLTQQGAIMGTPAYMAPEQGRGDDVDGRCDLFSLGVVLYRMCSGKLPFQGKDTVSTLMEVATHEPTPPVLINVELPQELSDLVMKLLEKDAAKRPDSAREVVERLQQIEGTQIGEPSRVSGRVERQRVSQPGRSRGSARRPIVLIAVAAVVATLLFWRTGNGTVRLEINDPEIQIFFANNGPTFKGITNQDITLPPGEHRLRVLRDDLELDTEPFVVKKGEAITLKIEWLNRSKLQVLRGDDVIASKLLPKYNGEWKQLFNGRDLTGWKEFPGSEGGWEVNKAFGVIARSKKGATVGCLFTERGDYENFHCIIEAKLAPVNAHAGFYLHSKFDQGSNQLGYHLPLKSQGTAKKATRSESIGSVSGFFQYKDDRPVDKEWFKLEVITRGNHVVTKVDGELAADFVDKESRYQRGHLALQWNTGLFQVRKVEIMELPPGPGPFPDDPDPKAQEAGWGPLVFGNDTSAWKASNFSKWELKDGVVTGSNTKTNSSDVTLNNRKFKDFELKYQVKLKKGQTGVAFRFQTGLKAAGTIGPFVDFATGSWGSLQSVDRTNYTTLQAAKVEQTQKAVKLDDFNDFHVKCVGKHCTIQMNGLVTVDDEFPSLPDDGMIGLTLRGVGEVTYRNIYIRELNAAKTAATPTTTEGDKK